MAEETITTVVDDPHITPDPSNVDQSTTVAAWQDGLPDDIKSDETLGRFEDVGALAKSYLEARTMIGSDTVKIPGTNATDDERSAFYSKLGRPDQADGYTMPTEGMPEDFEIDDLRLGKMRDAAHAVGISEQQFAALLRADANFASEQMLDYNNNQQLASDENVAKLRADFGDAFDQQIALAQRAVRFSGGDELKTFLDQSGMGNSPAMVKAFAKIGLMISDDEVVGGGHGQPRINTPEGAKQKIAAKRADKEFNEAYFDDQHPGHQNAIREMNELQTQAAPESDLVDNVI